MARERLAAFLLGLAVILPVAGAMSDGSEGAAQACNSTCRMRFSHLSTDNGKCLKYSMSTCLHCWSGLKCLCAPKANDTAGGTCDGFGENILYYADSCEPVCPTTNMAVVEATISGDATVAPVNIHRYKCSTVLGDGTDEPPGDLP